MRKEKLIQIRLFVPESVQNKYKIKKLQENDKRTLDKIYVEVLTNNIK